MVGWIRYVYVVAVLGVGQCIHETALGMQTENVYQWRQNTSDGTTYLFSADSNETDSFGWLEFSCALHSGIIKAKARIDENSTGKFAKLIAKNIYPTIKIEKDNSSKNIIVLDSMVFEDMGGWHYNFELDASKNYFSNFSKSGSLHFTIGGIFKDGVDLGVGLEEIAEFRTQCLVETALRGGGLK